MLTVNNQYPACEACPRAHSCCLPHFRNPFYINNKNDRFINLFQVSVVFPEDLQKSLKKQFTSPFISIRRLLWEENVPYNFGTCLK